MPTKAKDNSETATEPEALATVKADMSELGFDFAAMAALQQDYGITPADITVPVPATPTKFNLDQLCNLKTPVTDQYGNEYSDVNGHSGPVMFIEKQGEYDGDKFTGYDGFYVYALAIPGKGKAVITIGRPVAEKKPAVVVYLDMLTKGQLFQVASFATSKGFRVFNPIPVQANGKLIG